MPKNFAPRIAPIVAVVLLATAVSGISSPAGAQGLPSRWSVTDVGGPAVAGTATFLSPAFTVNSSGYDVNGTADQFTYVYRSLRGNSSVIVKVASLQNTNPWSQAGIMFRDSLAPGSSDAFVFASASYGVVFRTRRWKGSQTVQNAMAVGAAPVWLRLDRRSSKMIAYRSIDGVNWTLMGSQSLSMSSTYLVGVAVASHGPGATAQAVLSNVTVNGQGLEASSNAAPTVSFSTDKTSYLAPAAVAMTAVASDSDGSVSKVDFYDGSVLVGTRTASPFGMTWNTSAAGVHSLKAIATDNAGATATSSVVNVTVTAPNAVPTVSVQTDKGNYTAPASIVMSAVAADIDGSIAKVEFYNGTALVGTDLTSPYSFTWSGVPAGSYAIKAVATDNLGAFATSSVVTATVTAPNVAPTVSMTTDKASYTAPASVVMTAAAADGDGAVAKVDFYYGSTLVWTDAASPFTYTWTGAAAGNYTLKAVATDNAGASSTSAPVNISIAAANVAPTVSMTTDKSSYTAPASVAMTATAADSDGTIARVDFYSGSTLVGTDTTNPFAYTWTGAAAGRYALKVVATDNNGASTTSATVSITVAQAASSLVGAWIGSGGTGATLSDSSGNGRNGTISGATWVAGRVGQALDFGGAGVADLGDLDLTGAFTVVSWMQTRSLYTGTCGSLVMKALDYGFELCDGTLAAKVGSGGAWSAKVTRPMTSADLNTWKHVAMTYDGTTLRFYINGALIGSAAGAHATTNNPLLFGRWTPASEYWNGLIDEVRIYSATMSLAEIQADMAAGAAPNVAPTISLTTPVGGANFAAPGTIAIAATAADGDGTVAKVDFYAGATLLGTDATSPFAYTWTGVAAGSYALKAVATDNSGATTASAPVNITVTAGVNQAPTVSLTSPASGASFTAPASVTLNATASDSDGAIQKVEFYSGATLLGVDTTSPYTFSWANLVAGSYSVSAVATDNLGAKTVSTWSDFTVTAAPILSTAVFKPASPADGVNYYVLEVFALGADPNTAAPIATQNLGLPTVVSGECSADVRSTILGLAAGNYLATVSAVEGTNKLRSPSFAFTR